MTKFDLLQLIKKELDVNDIVAIKVYEHFFRCSYLLTSNETALDNEYKLLNNYFCEHKNYPYEYILGEIEVNGLRFKVDENVLIPREETEELYYFIIKNHILKPNERILDVCTGSGFLAILLNSYYGCETVGSDISKSAIEVAIQNAKLNNFNIEYVEGSFLKPFLNKPRFTLIVSNPPYIAYGEKVGKGTVYEPPLALYADKDGMEAYYEILNDLDKVLDRLGEAYFEISSIRFERYEKLAESYPNFNFEFYKDSFGRNRFMRVTYK